MMCYLRVLYLLLIVLPVHSRMEDVERGFERLECNITSYPPDESNPTGFADIAVSHLQVADQSSAFFSTSGKLYSKRNNISVLYTVLTHLSYVCNVV